MTSVARKFKQAAGCAYEYGGAFAFEQQLVQLLGNRVDGAWAHYHSHVLERLSLLPRYDSDYRNEVIGPDAPIWTFWAQGFDEAPELVQACRGSHKRFCGSHPVIELNLVNLADYIQVPSCVSRALDSGAIGLAVFADFVRLSLLSKYGGIWTDATCLFTERIPRDLESLEFYSIKQTSVSDRYVSQGKWAVWFLACGPSNQLLNECCCAFMDYWDAHEVLIDYFLTDYLFKLVSARDAVCLRQIDAVPICEFNPMSLRSAIVAGCIDQDVRNQLGYGFIQKLNYRDSVDSSILEYLRSFC